jgi:hypothetical protein
VSEPRHIEVILLTVFVLAIFAVVGSAFVIFFIASIRAGRVRWRHDPEPIERAKNPIAFWLSFAPFVFFVGMLVYVSGRVILDLCRGN